MNEALSLKDIAFRLGAEMLSGDPDAVVSGVSTLQKADSDEICYYGNRRYAGYLKTTSALAVLASEPVETSASCVLLVTDAYDAFRKVLHIFEPDRASGFTGIHPSSVIHPTAKLGQNVEAGPFSVIDRNCVIGSNCRIGSGTVIGPGTVLGDDCLIYPNVTLLADTIVGSSVIIHSGTVVGSDGFGFVPDSTGEHKKIPHNGNVVIGNCVEIGSNCSIDRAVAESTVIGDFTKLDNLIQVAHNVMIGRGCFIAAQTGIAGSTVIGNGVVFGGQVGAGGHLVINDGAVIAAKSGVTKNIEAGVTVSGNPARPHLENLRLGAAVSRLPKIIEIVKDLAAGKETED
jgi:UDP-3-O-[3-hydroxymyristoyl] glucosamine N-acyltransferase